MNFKILKQLSQNLSVLYIEDDEIVREKTSVIFKNLFKKVDVAEDGIEALKSYEDCFNRTSSYYDIVVTDIQMPRLNGIGLIKEIFKLNKKQIIIVTSAYNDKEYLVDLINIGVEAFMQKPLSSGNILEVLHEACERFGDECKDELVIFDEHYSFNLSKSILYFNTQKVELTEKELKILHLLVENEKQSFSTIEIFNHLYFDFPDKNFSSDAIKGLIKRLRKKIKEGLISNTQQLGYSINLQN